VTLIDLRVGDSLTTSESCGIDGEDVHLSAGFALTILAILLSIVQGFLSFAHHNDGRGNGSTARQPYIDHGDAPWDAPPQSNVQSNTQGPGYEDEDEELLSGL
jgi:hypothetical protein